MTDLRKLDWLIAEHMMGTVFKKDPDDENPRAILRSMCPKYSSDTVEAWKVVEKMRELGFSLFLEAAAGGLVAAEFSKGWNSTKEFFSYDMEESICRASLAALGVKYE